MLSWVSGLYVRGPRTYRLSMTMLIPQHRCGGPIPFLLWYSVVPYLNLLYTSTSKLRPCPRPETIWIAPQERFTRCDALTHLLPCFQFVHVVLLVSSVHVSQFVSVLLVGCCHGGCFGGLSHPKRQTEKSMRLTIWTCSAWWTPWVYGALPTWARGVKAGHGVTTQPRGYCHLVFFRPTVPQGENFQISFSDFLAARRVVFPFVPFFFSTCGAKRDLRKIDLRKLQNTTGDSNVALIT